MAAGLSGCATHCRGSARRSGSHAPSASSSRIPAPTGAAAPGRSARRARGTADLVPDASGTQRPDLKRSVYFEFDKYEVKPEYRALVDSHARWLKANPQARLTIEGNADEQGSREYNLALGQRRAESVTKMMVLMGVKPEQIEAVSWGEERRAPTAHDEKPGRRTAAAISRSGSEFGVRARPVQ